MLRFARAAAGDDGRIHGRAHRLQQRDIVAALRAIPIHAGEQDLARAPVHRFLRPGDDVQARGLAPAVGNHFPAVRAALAGVDGHNDALIPEQRRALTDEIGVFHRSGVDADLVRARGQHFVHIVHRAQAPAHGEGNEHLIGHGSHHPPHDAAAFVGGGDIQEDEFVRALGVIDHGLLHGIARVPQVDEVDALDHAAIFHVKTGNDAFGKHEIQPPKRTK